MNAYHQQNFAARYHTLGDQAEAIFDQVYPKNHQLGLRRPPFSMRDLTTAMRYVPDRMDGHRFVEVMGVGTDQILKAKQEKIDALELWRSIGPVYLFVFDSKFSRYWDEPLPDWLAANGEHGEDGMFHEGKAFRALHTSRFPGSPQTLDEAA